MKKGVGSGVGAGSGSESISQRYGSGDPDPHQNVTDPQHCHGRVYYTSTWGPRNKPPSSSTIYDPNDHLILFSLAEEGDRGGTGEQPGRVVAQLGQLTVVVTLAQLNIATVSHGLF